MKIVYAGTPEYAVEPLKKLVLSGSEVICVICGEDKPVGRKGVITPPPVKQAAIGFGIRVLQYKKIREHAEEIAALGADIMITCAYGQILSKDILACFPEGVWNLHASLLPLYRGASPIQSCILNGDKFTGVSVMKTEEGLDCGDILLVKRIPCEGKTYKELSDELSHLSAEAAVEAVELIKNGDRQLLVQDDGRATYCKKISKQDAKLDFNRSCKEVVQMILAMNPEPGAWCLYNGVTLNILRAAPGVDVQGDIGDVVCASKKDGIVIKCAQGSIIIDEAQLAGGKVLKSADLINGRKIIAGAHLD